MKKLLIATTALTLSAGFAAAEVKLGGYGYAGIWNDGVDTVYDSRIRLEFTGSTTTSAGTSFTAYVRMDTENFAVMGGGWSGTFLADLRSRITIKHDNLTLALGNTNGAMRTLARHLTGGGFNDWGIYFFSNSASTHLDNGASANALVRYDAGAFSVAASSDLAGFTQEIAVQYAANGFNVGAGIDTDGRWMVKALYSMGDLSMGIGHNSNGVTSANVAYTMGDWDMGLGVQNAGGNTDFGVDVGYSLGGGARLSASAGVAGGGGTLIGAGVMFSF